MLKHPSKCQNYKQ